MHELKKKLPTSSVSESIAQNGNSSKPIIERGPSWSFNETKILLLLWGQSEVQQELNNSKRTRHVWEKIAERIRESGFERTADQVRTRIFNMIAEYRRIMKNPTKERRKKCIFFDALHKYYAKYNNADLISFGDEHFNYEPLDFTTENMNGDDKSDTDEKGEIFLPSSPNAFTDTLNEDFDNTILNDINDDILPQAKRFRFENSTPLQMNNHNCTSSIGCPAMTSLYETLAKNFSKAIDIMQNWVNIQQKYLTEEAARKREENERLERNHKELCDVLMNFQNNFFSIIREKNLQITVSKSPSNEQAENNLPG